MNRTVLLIVIAVVFYFAGAMFPSIAKKTGLV